MNKKLAAKIQKLEPVVGETETVFSTSIAIEPSERDLVLKKGNVYTTFDIYSPVPLNVPLITKVINDVLYDSYYHSENISPIQSLEKAIVNINEKVSTLAAEAASSQPATEKKEGKVIFNTVACVLWGNVLYIVQYGKGKSYLMREGEVKEVSATSEGNFSVASGVVKNGDVIVLSTIKFAEKYPPDKLLDSSLSSKDLEPDNSCIILKFMVDEEFTDDEVIDFSVKSDKKGAKFPELIKGLKGKKDSKQKKQTIESLVDASTTSSPMKTHPRTPKAATSAPILTPKPRKDMPNIKMKSKRGPTSKLNTKSLMIIVSILLVLSVGVTLLIRTNQPSSGDRAQNQDQQGSSLFVPRDLNQNQDEQPQPEQPQPEQDEQTKKDAQEEQDALNKVARVDAQPFYDIKLVDENANPLDIVVFTNTVVATDSTSGKIFTSDITTPKFTAHEQAFPGIKDPLNYDGRLNFADEEGYKTYSLNDNTVADSFAGEFGVTSKYLGNIYSVEGNEIIKYVPSGEELDSSSWGTDESLGNSKALGIAYSIYAISQDNNLLVYTQGKRSSFTISDLDTPLAKVTDLAVDVNFDYIYLADAGNNRVVVLTTDGKFIKQIKALEDSDWSDIRGISVNTAESKMFLLNGSKVFEVDLTTADVAGTSTVAEEAEEPIEEPVKEEPVEEKPAEETVEEPVEDPQLD